MTSQFRNVLGYYQVIGGAFGMMVTLISLKQLETSDPLIIGIFAGGILLYGYSMLCGVLLLRAPALALSLRLSAANQLIQMLVISSKSFTYKFFSGLAIIVHVKTVPQLAVGFKAGLSTFLFNWGFANVEVFYGLNMVAFVLFVLIIQGMKGISESGHTARDQ